MPTHEVVGQWGILGGAFDPFHNGHITLAQDVLAAVGLDGVLFVPSFVPLRKNEGSVAGFEDRCKMVQLAIAGDARFQVSAIEAESAEFGYSLLTVRAIKKRYPKATFSFIIGADLLCELETWYEAQELVREVRIIVGSRPGAAPAAPTGFPEGAVTVVSTSLVNLASRDIRGEIASGITYSQLAHMTPPAVAKFILDRKLYS